MDLDGILQNVIDLAKGNPVAAAVVAAIFLFLLFRKARIFFILVLIAIAAKGIIYFLHKLSVATGLN